MLNVLVSGYSYEYTVPVIHRLEENGEISVKLWIYGDQKDELKIYHKDKIWWWDIVFGAWCNSDRYLSQAEQDYLTPKFHLFEQQIVREKLFELDSTYEIRNIIFKFVYYFKSQIKLNNVNLVLFDDIPHGAYNLILYYVAKMLKTNTIILRTSFWPDKSYICFDLDDYGTYKEVEGRMDVKEEFEKDLPYMKEITTKEKFDKTINKIVHISDSVNQKKDDAKRNVRVYDSFKRFLLMHMWRWAKRTIEKDEFNLNYKKYFVDKITEGEKYVYFPLHLQPEMTTDTLGGEYYDQLLAIEKLRNILPNDWKIYIKENPKQKAYMRGRIFYSRLCSIHNIRLVGKDVNTYDLIRGCEFVATIVGTAGWEAISGGKSVLFFGNTWYKHFSGATKYYDGVTVEEIIKNKPDHAIIEKQTFALQRSLYSFYIGEYYEALSELSRDENSNNMYEALSGAISDIEDNK